MARRDTNTTTCRPMPDTRWNYVDSYSEHTQNVIQRESRVSKSGELLSNDYSVILEIIIR